MSLALRMVVWTHTSVVTPVKTRFRTPLVRSTFLDSHVRVEMLLVRFTTDKGIDHNGKLDWKT